MGVPGLAKTMLIHSLSEVLDLEPFVQQGCRQFLVDLGPQRRWLQVTDIGLDQTVLFRGISFFYGFCCNGLSVTNCAGPVRFLELFEHCDIPRYLGQHLWDEAFGYFGAARTKN